MSKGATKVLFALFFFFMYELASTMKGILIWILGDTRYSLGNLAVCWFFYELGFAAVETGLARQKNR